MGRIVHTPARHGGPPGLGSVRADADLVYLEVPEAGVTACRALRLLREKHLAPKEVVRVDPFGVTFLNRCNVVRTAWIKAEEMSDGAVRLRVTVESGLPAFPTDKAHTA